MDMASSQPHPELSPYYPPRARWYGSAFYWGHRLFARLGMKEIPLPEDITLGGLLGGFFVPGLAVYFRKPGWLGKGALLLCGLYLAVFIIWLGYPVAGLAFGALLSTHTSGFVYYCTPLLEGSLSSRLLCTVLIMVALGLLVYLPAREALEDYALMPLVVNGNVVVVKRDSPRNVHRGDNVAYNLLEQFSANRSEDTAVRVDAGVCFGPVLAMPGDKIEFFAHTFTVNGIVQHHLVSMPTSGHLVVPEKHWFIWPDLGINEYRGAREVDIAVTLRQLALVSEEQLIGKPFQKWFWRRQISS